jgi:flagellar hook-associated protein 3 FlgL
MTARVSTSQMFSNAQAHIATAREREVSSANKAATQKEVTRPSQAPAEWTVAANLKDDLSVRETIAKNARFANSFLTASENTLAQLQELVGRTSELAIQASGSASVGAEQFYHLLPEVEGLYNNVIQTLNTQFANRPVFGGYQSYTQTFTEGGKFQGDDGKIEVEIDRNLRVPVNLSGSQIILGEGLQRGVNLIETYQTLLTGLREQDEGLVRESLEGLAQVVDQLSLGRTQIAGGMTEIQRALETHQVHEEQGKQVISQLEEADPVKVFSDLVRDQTVLRAAIETNSKVLNDNPIDTLLK